MAITPAANICQFAITQNVGLSTFVINVGVSTLSPSTGGTIRSVIEGVKKTGAVIQNIVVVVEKGPGMATLQKDYPEIRFDSLVKLEMDGEKVVIIE